jgi:hypothetical protein
MLKLVHSVAEPEEPCLMPDPDHVHVTQSMLERTPVPVLFLLAKQLGIEPASWEADDLVFLLERTIVREENTTIIEE